MAETTPSSPAQVRGIDVSHYQGTVNWPQVAGAGVAFAFIKATEGITTVDAMFNQNWNGVRAAGILRGAYHFYEPGDDPVQQAEHFLTVVPHAQGDLPPVLDIETAGSSTSAAIVQGITTWLGTVQQGTGRTPILYTGKSFWNTLGTTAFGGYPLWLAEYGVSTPVLPSGWSRWTFWQYSESGTVAGVSGQVDLDLFQGSLQALHTLAAGV